MLSKLQVASNIFSRLRAGQNQLNRNVITKRWSGHNAMEIEPTNFDYKRLKDRIHFYFMISMVPCMVVAAIINVRANPELTEIPEGYEPRHWEYFKHPVSRFLAKHLFMPDDIDKEMMLGKMEKKSENRIMTMIANEVDKVMSFYNDHRTKYFKPYLAEYYRHGRESYEYGIAYAGTGENVDLDRAYNPAINPVPTEGFKPVD